jgi:hypothetical protein
MYGHVGVGRDGSAAPYYMITAATSQSLHGCLQATDQGFISSGKEAGTIQTNKTVPLSLGGLEACPWVFKVFDRSLRIGI